MWKFQEISNQSCCNFHRFLYHKKYNTDYLSYDTDYLSSHYLINRYEVQQKMRQQWKNLKSEKEFWSFALSAFSVCCTKCPTDAQVLTDWQIPTGTLQYITLSFTFSPVFITHNTYRKEAKMQKNKTKKNITEEPHLFWSSRWADLWPPPVFYMRRTCGGTDACTTPSSPWALHGQLWTALCNKVNLHVLLSPCILLKGDFMRFYSQFLQIQ